MATLSIPTLEEMIEAGVHFGHRTSRWHPKIQPFIFGAREGVHIINLEETYKQLEQATTFLSEQAKNKANIVFVGTKRQAAAIVQKTAQEANVYYITHRWPGGLITNFQNIHKKILVYEELTDKQEKDERISSRDKYLLLKNLEQSEKLIGGLIGLTNPPDIIILVDPKREKTAVHEAKITNTPTVGIVDTNTDPTLIDYPIVANDDSLRSIELILDTLAKAVKSGTKANTKRKTNKRKKGLA